MDIWVIFSFGLLWMRLLWTFVHTLYGHMFSVVLGICVGVEVLGHTVILCLTSWWITRLFSKVVEPFYIPVYQMERWKINPIKCSQRRHMAHEQRSSKPPEPEISIPNDAELVKKILAVNTYNVLLCSALYICDDISSHFSFKGQMIREVENLAHRVLTSLLYWSSGNFGTCPVLRWAACLTVLNILAMSLRPLKGTRGPWTWPIWGSAEG